MGVEGADTLAAGLKYQNAEEIRKRTQLQAAQVVDKLTGGPERRQFSLTKKKYEEITGPATEAAREDQQAHQWDMQRARESAADRRAALSRQTTMNAANVTAFNNEVSRLSNDSTQWAKTDLGQEYIDFDKEKYMAGQYTEQNTLASRVVKIAKAHQAAQAAGHVKTKLPMDMPTFGIELDTGTFFDKKYRVGGMGWQYYVEARKEGKLNDQQILDRLRVYEQKARDAGFVENLWLVGMD